MTNNNTNIEYLLFVRSALQFKEDLMEICKVLDSLSDEQVIAVDSYLSLIREGIRRVERGFVGRD